MLVAKCNVCMNTSMHILSSCIYAFFPFGELCSENGIVKVLLPKARYCTTRTTYYFVLAGMMIRAKKCE